MGRTERKRHKYWLNALESEFILKRNLMISVAFESFVFLVKVKTKSKIKIILSILW